MKVHEVHQLVNGFIASCLVTGTLCASSVGQAAPAAFDVKPEQNSVEFVAVGKPGFLKINGKKAALKGHATQDGSQINGLFEVKLDDFETGIETRDEHMKDKYLETKKFPTATLQVKNLAVTPSGSPDVAFKGDLTLHGVTKEISGTAKVSWQNAGKDADVDAHFEITLSDFKIDIPQYLGVKVADTVNVSTRFIAHQK